MSSSADISDKVADKLKKIVKDKAELNMIIDLLKIERRDVYGTRASPQAIKKEFQLRLNQYFPLPEETKNER